MMMMQNNSFSTTTPSTSSSSFYQSNSLGISDAIREYHLRFITNSNARKEATANTDYVIDVDYLMSEAFDQVDSLNRFARKNSSNSIKLTKSELDQSDLAKMIDKYYFDRPNFGNRSPELPCLTEAYPVTEIYVISSFNTQQFNQLQSMKYKMIGPLTIMYWCRMMNDDPNFVLLDHLKKLDSGSLFSECMNGNVVYISTKFSHSTLIMLADRIQWMGGKVATELNSRVTHAIDCDENDPNVMAAYFFQIAVVSIDWVSKSWTHLQLQYDFSSRLEFVQLQLLNKFANIETKPLFKNMVIGIISSVYDNSKEIQSLIDRVHEVIVRFGGICVKNWTSLNYPQMNIVLHLTEDYYSFEGLHQLYEMASDKYLGEKKFGRMIQRKNCSISILQLKWLFKTIAKQSLQPYEPYKLRLANEDPNRSNSSMLAEEIRWIGESRSSIHSELFSEPSLSQMAVSGLLVDGTLRSQTANLSKSNSSHIEEEEPRKSWVQENYSFIQHLNEKRKKSNHEDNY